MFGEWISRAPAHRNCAFSKCIWRAILKLMVKISVAFRLRISYVCCNNASKKDSCTLQTNVKIWKKSFYRIEKGWLNESNNRSTFGFKAMRRIDDADKCGVNNSRYQGQDSRGRPRATVEREGRAIVREAVTAPDSSLSTIHRVVCTHVTLTSLHTVKSD